MDVQLFDSTLRDGTQSEGLSLSVEDKLKIARLLDGFGIHYIEGGYPGSNPKDVEFFQRAKAVTFRHAKLTAFGMTRKPGGRADSDPILQAMVAGADARRSPWSARPGTCTSPRSSARRWRRTWRWWPTASPSSSRAGREVVFDCEHFFDGFRADRDYALAVVKAASAAGADWIAMCDTNGGSLPGTITEVVSAS